MHLVFSVLLSSPWKHTLKIYLKNQQSNSWIAVQISLNQQSYLLCADKQQPWEIQEHQLPGLLRDALCYLYKQNEGFLSSHWNLMGHRLYMHVSLDSESAWSPVQLCSAAGSRNALQSGTCLTVSMWEQQSIDVNVPQSENWNNIKMSNRTKFLELHIKTESPLKQQIKISAEVFW